MNFGPIDPHVHLMGNGQGNAGTWCRLYRRMSPFYRATERDLGLSSRFDRPNFDQDYFETLVRWLDASSLQAAVLLGYDWVRDERGEILRDQSDMFVSNDAVMAAVQASAKFVPGVSIHPARPDALEELTRLVDAGAQLLKLLPCVQNVDPNLPRFRPFWTKLAEFGLPLLAHTGGEFCVRSCRNDLKSPRCLTLPLECGVNVIAAHCGTRALWWDGDHFDEFLAMRRTHQNLWGDLSPLSHITHLKSLERLRQEPERLLHASDYPVVSAVFPSRWKGWISRETCRDLQAIKNPLEKRIQLNRALGFPEQVFTDLWRLLPAGRAALDDPRA